MPIFWLDACVLIEAKDGPYAFERVPSFWGFLDEQLNAGALCCPSFIFGEILVGKDRLAQWCSARKQNGLCVQPVREVQSRLTEIADYVVATYESHQANRFLTGGDPWLIAHAWHSGGAVVTQEADRDSNAKKVRIPDVCANFGVECINLYEMTDRLGLSI